MPQLMAFLPLITAVAGPLLSKMTGGGGEKQAKEKAAAVPQAAKNLFTPQQITQATDKYGQTGNAKWNQIMAGMGAGGGTGGPDVNTQIGTQANAMGTALGQLNTDSGYGENPMANLDQILKGVEGGISPKYSVYG